MSSAKLAFITEADLKVQPDDLTDFSPEERDRLVVSYERIGEDWVPLSFYGEDEWQLAGGPTNRAKSHRKLNFRRFPESFRATAKVMTWRYMRRGREGGKIPDVSTLISWVKDARSFLFWLAKRGIAHLSDASPMACLQYVEAEKARTSKRGKPLSPKTLNLEFIAVEAIHELSQFTSDPMPAHPWPDSSAKYLAQNLSDCLSNSKTPLIPDVIFCMLFQCAWEMIQKGGWWLDLRDGIDRIQAKLENLSTTTIRRRKSQFLKESGWEGGLEAFETQLIHLRTACYIVVASLSGCRNHELAYIQSESFYSREDDEGETYWWLKSRSDKTGEGYTEWMIPEAAVLALRVLERWAERYRDGLKAEILRRTMASPDDPEIAEVMRHRDALFLGEDSKFENQIRTLAIQSFNSGLLRFAQKFGIEWSLATHQFRRKFANYAARSQFGDLRYLKEHFKHWSMDMTLTYALNESQDLDLYLEIEDELDDLKVAVVEEWLHDDVPLAGGLGNNVVEWRGSHPITLFKDQGAMVRSLADSISLRSALHAWCAADNGGCVGLWIDRMRCPDCDNAVIHTQHAHIYERQYHELKSLLNLKDIGETGLNRVRSGMAKCQSVLMRLGIELHNEPAQGGLEDAI